MFTFDPHDWDRHYQRGIAVAGRESRRVVDRFRQSCETWLHGALNWPEDDWESDLRRFIQHSQSAGIRIEPESQDQLRALLEARVRGTGVFALPHEQEPPRVLMQLAAAPGANGTASDAEVNLSAPPDGTYVNGIEVAGPGPETTQSYQDKVRLILDQLDEVVARIWRQRLGYVVVRRRNWLQFRYYSETREMRLVLVVSPNFTPRDAAEAILKEAYASGANAINAELHKRKLLTAKEIDRAYREMQSEAFSEAAEQAAVLAELFVSSIGSLTPSGDLIVTIDDIGRNGIRWDHLLIALPMMAQLRKGIRRLVVKLPDGKTFALSQSLLNKLRALTDRRRRSLIRLAQREKTQTESVNIIKRGLTAFDDGGQIHHAISKRVHDALEEHPNLRGRYRRRDDRFELITVNRNAHHGYEEWHVDIDDEISRWIRNADDATPANFEAMLRERYERGDLRWRFISGL